MSEGPLHEGCPWREVTFIDEQRGPRGGETWVLTLDCGHTAFRPKKPSRPDQLGIAMMLGHVERYLRSREAPRRVRCWSCGNQSTD